MIPARHIPCILQALFGLLLVCWPVFDTTPAGAITGLRIALGCGMLLLSAAAIMTAGFRKQPVKWNLTDWAVLACSVWYVGNVVFIGGRQTDPYSLLCGLVILTAYAFCRMAGSAVLLPAMLVSGLVQAGIATAQLCGWAATRHAYHDLTGSFPNPGPLGGWLCVTALAAVVLTLQFWKQRRKVWAVLCAGGGLYIGIILLLTDSRAAWVGLAAGIFGMLCTLRFRYKRTVLLSLAVIALAGSVFLYGYKKDSADGRLLVWRVSADMIAVHPVAGSGVGTFPDRYMFAQGDYFAKHPDSRFTAVAEQTSYPFNELVGVTCEQGIVGGLLFLLLVGSVLVRRGNAGGKALLIGLSVFGLFSYPSAFLAFGMLFGALLADRAYGPGYPLSRRTMGIIAGVILLAGGTLLCSVFSRRNALANRYTLAHRAFELTLRGDPNELPELERMARRLPIAGFYVELGDLYLKADSTERAKYYYRTAARMIPSRLKPYDGLFRAYLRAGQLDSAATMARRIVTMPVKVSNTATIRIRQTAKEWLETQNTDL
ncbi:MAG: O-antigen ligase family protein [Rikenellaceae bacterium]|nr:O-antigen ligase family protein [Rikenellaceae bacterium]